MARLPQCEGGGARAWITIANPELPPEIGALLGTSAAFGPVVEWRAEPEARVRFDSFPGEPRNTDLLVHATDTYDAFVMSVEAKATRRSARP